MYEKISAVHLCCVSVLWKVLGSYQVDSPEHFSTEGRLAASSSLTACLFTGMRSYMVIIQAVSIFKDKAL